jgi:hypothetical protein
MAEGYQIKSEARLLKKGSSLAAAAYGCDQICKNQFHNFGHTLLYNLTNKPSSVYTERRSGIASFIITESHFNI